jgi:4-hydroxy-tetrahydrodipicolinate synthase
VNAAGIMRLIRALGTADEASAVAQVSAVRAACEGMPLIPGVKAVVAARMGDQDYARVRPPLLPLNGEQTRAAMRAAELCLWEETPA